MILILSEDFLWLRLFETCELSWRLWHGYSAGYSAFAAKKVQDNGTGTRRVEGGWHSRRCTRLPAPG
jgi:hypothetical protein